MGRKPSVVTVRAFSGLATCYPVLTGLDWPQAVLQILNR